MADPKYENLPGIAYDQPDVYESGDLPEADQPPENEEEENECIERMNLSVNESYSKFKGKRVSGSVDFSDRIGRKIRTGYKCGEWELAAEGEVETPQERLQRLKCETSELIEQLIAMGDKSSEDGKMSVKEMTTQIASTKQILDDLNFDEGLKKDPESERLKKLLEKADAGVDKGQKITTVIKLRPEATNPTQTARLAKLEHRLHKLEAVIGKAPERLERLGGAVVEGKGLIDTVNALAARTAVLQPSQLDAAEVRLNRLLPAMEALKAASTADAETNHKVNEIYDMVKKADIEKNASIVYLLLGRLQALEELNKQANDFGKSMPELKALQDTIATSVQNNKLLFQGVQEVFAVNIDNIQKAIKKLEDKVSNAK